MKARHLDSTITDFIGNLVKYAILAFVLHRRPQPRRRADCFVRRGDRCRRPGRWLGLARLPLQPASGVLIILFRSIKVGEFVDGRRPSGVVQTVQIFTTVLTTGDNRDGGGPERHHLEWHHHQLLAHGDSAASI